MDVDWNEIFAFKIAPLEMFIRGTITYWFVFLLLRLAGRRDAGTLGVADLLVLVLIGDAAGNAMAPGDASLIDGMIVVASLIFWSVAVDRIGYFFPPTRKFLEPGKVCLVKDGVMQKRGMRREYITEEELLESVRLAGLERVAQVKRAYMESNGEISIISHSNEEIQRNDLRSKPE
jgi:uncharacterized membrane protein YcaP (DUF421 family)